MFCQRGSNASLQMSYCWKCPAWCPPKWRWKQGNWVSVIELSLRYASRGSRKSFIFFSEAKLMKYSLNVKTGLIMWIDYVEKYKQLKKWIQLNATPMSSVLVCLFAASWNQVLLCSRSGDEIRSALTEYFSLRLILTYLPLIKLQTHLPNTKGGEQSSSECLALAKPALSPTARKTGTLSCNLRVLQVAMARKISISSTLQEGN